MGKDERILYSLIAIGLVMLLLVGLRNANAPLPYTTNNLQAPGETGDEYSWFNYNAPNAYAPPIAMFLPNQASGVNGSQTDVANNANASWVDDDCGCF